MKSKSLKLANFAKMSAAERKRALRDLLAAALKPANGGLTALDAEIQGYEKRFRMTTDTMLVRVEAGRQEETSEVASWLIAADLRRRILERQARPE